jgi:hypothetical protein
LAQVTIEYMIMIPVLIAQIFIFPFAAQQIMNVWSDSQMTLELKDVAGQLSSSIQQVYYTLDHQSISSGSITVKLNLPLYITGGNYRNYNYTITLQNAVSQDSGGKVINLSLKLIGSYCQTSTIVTLGQNAAWQDGFTVNRFNAALINATKTDSGVIWITFGGT